MNELQRQAYLRAMGVECYFPRTQLPGALASVQCLTLFAKVITESDVLDVDVDVDVSSVSDAIVNNHPIHSLKELFDDPLQSSKTSSRLAVTPQQNLSSHVAGKQQTNTENPVFSCRFYKGRRFLLLVDAITEEYADDYDQLVKNILFALGDEPLPVNPNVFSWPMVSSSAIDQSLAVAQESLSVHIAQLIDSCTLIALGEIANYLPVRESVQDKLFIDPATGYRYLFSISAIDLLNRPELKTHLWRSLSSMP